MMGFPMRLRFADVLRRPARPELSAGQRAGAFAQRFRIDGRRGHGLLAVLVTAALALFVVSRFANTEVVLWDDWSGNAARAFIVVGPVFAAWSAMLASRDAKPNRIDLVEATATPVILRELGHAAMGMLAALACYGIVAAVVLGYAARHATWGGPDWWIVSFGGSVTALYALGGWLIGTFVPGRLTPVVTGAGAFLYTVVSYTWGLTESGSDALQPWRYIEGRWALGNRLFYETSAYMGMPHPAGGVLIATGIGALLIGGYLWLRSGILPVVLGAVAVVMLIPGWVLANSTDMMPLDAPALLPNPPMVCAGEVVEVCLHQAYAVQLDDGVAFAEAFYAPVAGLAGVPERVTQQVLPEPPAGTVALNSSWTNTGIETVMVMPMGESLMGVTYTPGYRGLNASQHAILTWLAEQAGGRWFIGMSADLEMGRATPVEWAAYHDSVDAAAGRFAALPPEEQRAWLEANWDALRAGDLTLEDLP